MAFLQATAGLCLLCAVILQMATSLPQPNVLYPTVVTYPIPNVTVGTPPTTNSTNVTIVVTPSGSCQSYGGCGDTYISCGDCNCGSGSGSCCSYSSNSTNTTGSPLSNTLSAVVGLFDILRIGLTAIFLAILSSLGLISPDGTGPGTGLPDVLGIIQNLLDDPTTPVTALEQALGLDS